MNEQETIQRLKQGDVSGLEFLVTRHQVKALRILCPYSGYTCYPEL